MAKLRFYYGTMNSSKTANLLMVRHNYLEQGKQIQVFKPAIDTRDVGVVKSRALNEKVPAILVDSSTKDFIFDSVKKERPSCVLIDEVQFLNTLQIIELGRIVDELNIPVIAYGLLTDFKGELFEGSKKLIEIGAVLSEIKTVCMYCTTKASYNMRLNNGKPVTHGEIVQVGGNESYQPVCRKHYNEFTQGKH